MATTIKQLAKELNCSYEAVRKQTKRYAEDLKDHIYTQHKTQYLDDYACDFIRSKRMDSPVTISRIEHDEAVELLKQKYTELLEKHNQLRDERDDLIRRVGELESDNERLSLLEAKQGENLANAEKDAQIAREELREAQKENESLEKRIGEVIEVYEAEKKTFEQENLRYEKELADRDQKIEDLKNMTFFDFVKSKFKKKSLE